MKEIKTVREIEIAIKTVREIEIAIKTVRERRDR